MQLYIEHIKDELSQQFNDASPSITMGIGGMAYIHRRNAYIIERQSPDIIYEPWVNELWGSDSSSPLASRDVGPFDEDTFSCAIKIDELSEDELSKVRGFKISSIDTLSRSSTSSNRLTEQLIALTSESASKTISQIDIFTSTEDIKPVSRDTRPMYKWSKDSDDYGHQEGSWSISLRDVLIDASWRGGADVRILFQVVGR